jgi:hypothetical protein
MDHRLARRLLVILALSLSLASPAMAVVVEQLHEVEVPVKDQSPDARAAAFKVALAEVIVRLTGDARAPAAPAVAPLLRSPQRFVAEFAYVALPAEPGVPAMATGPGAVPAMRLAVRFEGPALQAALRDAGRAVLGRERPRTLIWLVLDEGGDRDLVGVEDADAFVAAAASRGLPLIFPALDAVDRAALTAADLVVQDDARIGTASARPGADGLAPEAWLGAQVWRAPRAWQGRFTLGITLDGSVERFEAKASTLDGLAVAAMDRVAMAIAARYAVTGSELLSIELAVEAIDALPEYAAITGLLRGMSIVRRVDVIGVEKDLLELKVAFIGGATALERSIALDPRFARSVEAARAGTLRYRYAP